MASRRLWILTVLAVLAVAAVTIDMATSTDSAIRGTRLFPSISLQELERIRWTEGKEIVEVERRGETFVIARPDSGPARESVIRAFVGALSILEASPVDGPSPAVDRTIAVVTGGRTTEIGLARTPSGTLLVTGGRAHRVADHLARELDLQVADLRPRRPFPELGRAEATGIIIGLPTESVVLEGPPWTVLLPNGRGRAWADPDVVASLERELRALRWREFREVPADAEPLFYVRLRTVGDWAELAAVGTCEDGYLMTSPAGSGCIAGPAIQRVIAMGEAADALIDRHLVVPGRRGEIDGFAIERDGASLRVANQGGIWRAGGVELDSEQVVRWLRRLDDIIVPTPQPAGAAGETLATVILELSGGQRFAIEVVRDGEKAWIHRQGEEIRWPAAAGWSRVVRPDPDIFRSLELIERPWTDLQLAVASRRDRVIERIRAGDTLGNWETERGRVLPQAAQELATSVGYLGAVERLTDVLDGPPEREIELGFRDSGQGTLAVRLELRARDDDGCIARLAGVDYRLAAGDCEALYGPWTTSSRRLRGSRP